MTFEVRNKEINSQCAELLVRPLYIHYTIYIIHTAHNICTSFGLYNDILTGHWTWLTSIYVTIYM